MTDEQHEGYLVRDRRQADEPEPKKYHVTHIRHDDGTEEITARDASGKVVDYIRRHRDGRIVETKESESLGFAACAVCGGTHPRFSGDGPLTPADCPKVAGASMSVNLQSMKARTPHDIGAVMHQHDADAPDRRGTAHLQLLGQLIGEKW